MSVSSFDYLLSKIADSIRGIDTAMRSCIGNEEKLLVTLRYLATGNSFVDLHHSYRLGVTTIKEIVSRVCSALWNILQKECLPEPTKGDWLRTAAEFEKRANFPNCLGAVDGKHIRIVKPQTVHHCTITTKNYFSIILMAVTDANYQFVYVDIGSYGKCGDSTIFQQSTLYQRINTGTMDIPEDRPISQTRRPYYTNSICVSC
uniref:DDE Tnp4 domain-containing protein n=1 Tax=Homalodisca liturata TaxID=320908 RepID=A0A1B6H8T0_9HEMI